MANLVVVTTAPTSLNFLIYVQNLYLSQKKRGQDRFPSYRVPYFVFHENFEQNFRQLWTTIIENLEKDLPFFYEQKDIFCAQLFNHQAASLVKFEDIYRTFQNWWGSFAGNFAIERAADDKMSQLYVELTAKFAVDIDKITVSIVYDDCIFVPHEMTQTMTIISLPEIYLRYEDVVERIVSGVSVAGE